MKRLLSKLKSSRFINTGIIKKIKDRIYYKFLEPRGEAKTDKYRGEILEKIGRIFEGCEWELLAGGFLKFYRDNDMSGQDLDIYILNTDFEKVKEKFFDEGFKIKQVFMDENKRVTEYKYLYKNVEVDIFMVFQNKNQYTQCFTLVKNDKVVLDQKVVGNERIISGKDYITYTRKINSFKGIKQYEYNGIKFNGPKQAEQMMIDMYGYSWNVYDPNYDSRTSPDNNLPTLQYNSTSIVYINPLSKYPKS